MTKPTSLTATLFGSLAALLAASACSGSGGSADASETTTRAAVENTTEADAFCTGAKRLYKQAAGGGSTEDGREIFAAAEGLRAPAKIAADWELVLTAVEPLIDSSVTPSLDVQAVQDAGVFDRVGAYISETCDIH